jgi:glycosyltransferase involved in cell wall biosynthesis
MKAVICLPIDLTQHSAGRTRATLMRNALISNGVDAKLVGIGSVDQSEEIQHLRIGSVDSITIRPDSKTTNRQSAGRLRSQVKCYSNAFEKSLKDVLVELRPNIIIDYCTFYSISKTVLATARLLKVPIVGDLVEQKKPNIRRILNGAAYEQFARDNWIVPMLDGIIGISNAWVDWANSRKMLSCWVPPLLNSKFEITTEESGDDGYNSLAPMSEESADLVRRVSIAWIGHWNSREHIEVVLNAVRLLVRENLPISLDVIGNVERDGYSRKLVRNVRRDSVLAKRVHFHGFLDDDQRDELMSKSALFILLRSESNETRKLFPTRLPEYLGTSRPVILSRCSTFSSIFRHGSNIWFIDSANDCFELASSIRHLIDNPTIADRIGFEGALLASECFSGQLVGERLKKFLERVIEQANC